MRSKYKIEKYIGLTINNWTILGFSHVNEKSEQHWMCKCKCGLEKPVRVSHLIREINKGCRHCRGQASKRINSKYWKGGEFLSSTIYTTYKISAKNRNIYFNITIQDLEEQWKLQNGKCTYTKLILTLPDHNRDNNSNASIDRIDSKKGYEKGNIQWVLKDINIMKMALSHERFVELCEIVSNNK